MEKGLENWLWKSKHWIPSQFNAIVEFLTCRQKKLENFANYLGSGFCYWQHKCSKHIGFFYSFVEILNSTYFDFMNLFLSQHRERKEKNVGLVHTMARLKSSFSWPLKLGFFLLCILIVQYHLLRRFLDFHKSIKKVSDSLIRCVFFCIVPCTWLLQQMKLLITNLILIQTASSHQP